MYCKGEGVKLDYRQGAEWLQKAAQQNYAAAQASLAYLYQNGLGVPLNYSEAYKWLRLAADGGHKASKRALNPLKQIMTVTQLRDAQTSLSTWLAEHNNLELEHQKAQEYDTRSYDSPSRP
jgi:TPR repeat protein